MWKSILAVACGGALGACARFGLSLWLNPSTGLSWGTLCANLLGCLLAGGFLAWLHLGHVSDDFRLFFQVGILGALTTFSAFAAETYSMVLSQRWGLALAYCALNGMGSLFATALGYRLGLQAL